MIDIGALRTTIMQIGERVNADAYNAASSGGQQQRVQGAGVQLLRGIPVLWDEIMVPVSTAATTSWRADPGEVAEEVVGDYALLGRGGVERITRRYLIEKASVHPMVTKIADENWIELTLRYVVDYKARRSTKDRLFTRILEEIDKCRAGRHRRLDAEQREDSAARGPREAGTAAPGPGGGRVKGKRASASFRVSSSAISRLPSHLL